MPAVSKQQFKLMQGIRRGSIKKRGMSPMMAKEFTEGVDYKSLPKKKKKRGWAGGLK